MEGGREGGRERSELLGVLNIFAYKIREGPHPVRVLTINYQDNIHVYFQDRIAHTIIFPKLAIYSRQYITYHSLYNTNC